MSFFFLLHIFQVWKKLNEKNSIHFQMSHVNSIISKYINEYFDISENVVGATVNCFGL